MRQKLRRRDWVRAQLQERATAIPPGEQEAYTPIVSIAHAMKRDPEPVFYEIVQLNFPVYVRYERNKPLFCIPVGIAKTYSEEYAQIHEMQEATKIQKLLEQQRKKGMPPGRKPIPIGGADRCGVCHTTRGNILAVHDKDHRVRAYLCTPCWRIATSFKWEPGRMRNMAKIIEAVGLEHLQS